MFHRKDELQVFKNKTGILVAEKVERRVLGQRKLSKYIWYQPTTEIDGHLCVELEGSLVHSSTYLDWMDVGGREMKVVAEAMDESSMDERVTWVEQG